MRPKTSQALEVLFTCLMGCVIIPLTSFADASSPPVRIDGIRVMPYYVDQGVVRASTDLLDKRVVLRNVVISPGSAGDPLNRPRIEDWDLPFGTTATFVDVAIAALDVERVPRQLRISFIATGKTSGRTIASQNVLLSAVMVRGVQKFHVPFLVYGTGCEPLELRVQLRDSSAISSELVRTVPFTCGE
jgi:hypothetical protein